MAASVSIIIVNYKTPQLTERCIRSIYNSDISEHETQVIVVDNASNDSSDKLPAKFPEIKWIQSESNIGFGAANNLGIQHSEGEFILFLNSDIQVNEDTISKCIKRIKESGSGLLGCKLVDSDGKGIKSEWHYVVDLKGVLKENFLLDRLANFKKGELKAVTGAFMLTQRVVLDQAGYFDPDFFLYSEEMELCYRIRKAGYRIEYFPDAVAVHEQGGSTPDKYWGKRHRELSNALMMYKIHGTGGYFLYLFLRVFNTASNILYLAILRPSALSQYLNRIKAFYSNSLYYPLLPIQFQRKWGGSKKQLTLKKS